MINDERNIMSLCLLSKVNIKHAYAKGRAWIGLDKKARLILHGGHPIMAYYNPIILDDFPIMPRYHVRTRYSLSAFAFGNFLEQKKFFPFAKGLNCERFSITESLHNFSLLLSYVHHILSRRYVVLHQ